MSFGAYRALALLEFLIGEAVIMLGLIFAAIVVGHFALALAAACCCAVFNCHSVTISRPSSPLNASIIALRCASVGNMAVAPLYMAMQSSISRRVRCSVMLPPLMCIHWLSFQRSTQVPKPRFFDQAALAKRKRQKLMGSATSAPQDDRLDLTVN